MLQILGSKTGQNPFLPPTFDKMEQNDPNSLSCVLAEGFSSSEAEK
jgi:hypothetical protein